MARGVHIVREEATGWAVKREGAKRASSSHKTQAEAVAAGRRLALKSGGAEVVVHRSDGRVRDVDTVGAAKLDALKRGKRSEDQRKAPRGDGPRTTLRLPESLARIADQLAKDLEVSRNDAVLRLATRGARLFAQEQKIRERRERRWAAVVPGIVDIDDAKFPSQAEAQNAIFAQAEEVVEPTT
ncbi:MAG: DUF2188 domain-containing protein [Thermoleophilaceae bacterium]|jgi:hypothetical protein